MSPSNGLIWASQSRQTSPVSLPVCCGSGGSRILVDLNESTSLSNTELAPSWRPCPPSLLSKAEPYWNQGRFPRLSCSCNTFSRCSTWLFQSRSSPPSTWPRPCKARSPRGTSSRPWSPRCSPFGWSARRSRTWASKLVVLSWRCLIPSGARSSFSSSGIHTQSPFLPSPHRLWSRASTFS